MLPAILNLKFPFELKDDQIKAVNAWLSNNFKGSIIYSTGTGKTEIAFECARRLAEIRLAKDASSPAKPARWGNPKEEFRILFVVQECLLSRSECLAAMLASESWDIFERRRN